MFNNTNPITATSSATEHSHNHSNHIPVYNNHQQHQHHQCNNNSSNANSWLINLQSTHSIPMGSGAGRDGNIDINWYELHIHQYLPQLTTAIQQLILSCPTLIYNSTVLDLCCGTGLLTIPYIKAYNNKNIKLTILDQDQSRLNHCCEKLQSIYKLKPIIIQAKIQLNTNTNNSTTNNNILTNNTYELIISSLAIHEIVGHNATTATTNNNSIKQRYIELFELLYHSLIPGGHLIYIDYCNNITAYEQLQYLSTAGFIQCDIAWRIGELAIIGGRKPIINSNNNTGNIVTNTVIESESIPPLISIINNNNTNSNIPSNSNFTDLSDFLAEQSELINQLHIDDTKSSNSSNNNNRPINSNNTNTISPYRNPDQTLNCLGLNAVERIFRLFDSKRTGLLNFKQLKQLVQTRNTENTNNNDNNIDNDNDDSDNDSDLWWDYQSYAVQSNNSIDNGELGITLEVLQELYSNNTTNTGNNANSEWNLESDINRFNLL